METYLVVHGLKGVREAWCVEVNNIEWQDNGSIVPRISGPQCKPRSLQGAIQIKDANALHQIGSLNVDLNREGHLTYRRQGLSTNSVAQGQRLISRHTALRDTHVHQVNTRCANKHPIFLHAIVIFSLLGASAMRCEFRMLCLPDFSTPWLS